MNSSIIKCIVSAIDERLPYQEFMEQARKQADAMPLEIEQDGVIYEVFDVQCHIEKPINYAIASYRRQA